MNYKAINDFGAVADKALLAMKKRAKELNIKGVAVVACSKGRTVKSWSSKMLVVGHLTAAPSSKRPAGSNFLAIAYTKACGNGVHAKGQRQPGAPSDDRRDRLERRRGGPGEIGVVDCRF